MQGNPIRARLLIADDHESVRLGLRALLTRTPDFEVVGEAHSVETTLRAIDAFAPDILVLDFALGEESGAQVLDALAARSDAPKVLMLSMEDERVVGAEMKRRGAAAYVMKHAPTSEILAALRKIRTSAVESVSPPLTRREQEVLVGLKHGLASKAIARRLAISAKTVDVHKHRLRRKLGLRTDMELARYAALFADRSPTQD
jgi:DNA-binding NarL/FixJ family response regulator